MLKKTAFVVGLLLFLGTAESQDPDTVLTVTIPNGEFMRFAWIQPGDFLMGSGEDDVPQGSDELPPHEVTLTTGFYMGIFEITQGQWRAVMGTNPWRYERYVVGEVKAPAVYISWDDVQDFISKLNKWEGAEVYRLPTEAEWEYAARGFTSSLWHFGDSPNSLHLYAWYWTNAWNRGEAYAHAVGSKLPNALGLYDTHGNVWEWVQDWYGPYSGETVSNPQSPLKGTRKVLRGGGFVSPFFETRSAVRSAERPDARFSDIGARLVRRFHPPTTIRQRSWGEIKRNANRDSSEKQN